MVNYGIYLLTIVALVLLVSIVRHSAYMERKRNFQYDITALCVVVALASVVGRDYAGTHHIYWLAVVSSFLIDTASVVYFLFFIGSLRSWKSAVMIAFEIVGGVIVLMAIASPVTGWLYKISADGAFEKGDYQSIAALYLILGFIALIVINFKKYRNCELEDIVRMIFLFSLEAIAIVLQVLEAEMFQDGFIGSALLIILYYDFVIEIESKYDNLTGVGSSTYFDSYVDRINKKDEYQLLMFDVNGLKQTNDTMGHEAGDELITTVGQAIKAVVLSSGKVFRVGGDEFMVICPETDKKGAFICVERMQKAISNITIVDKKVSFAYGVAHSSEDYKEMDDMLHNADVSMYECKKKMKAERRG